MDKFAYLGSADIEGIEKLYQQYKEDPGQIDQSWKKFFEGFEFAQAHFTGMGPDPGILDREFKVINLIEGYRKRGHLFTVTNPVRVRRKYTPTLDPENYGLHEDDLDTVFHAGNHIGLGPARLRDIITHLQQTYCLSVGAEYMFIRRPEILAWLQGKMEGSRNTSHFTPGQRKHIYFHLKQAVGFESFIHKKFVGAKRFSLEGAESLIPSLDAVIEHGSGMGISEFVIGMAHRGRLNVLANILRKPYEDILGEFTGDSFDDRISLGDVKYHLGYCNTVTTDAGREVRLNLVPNPSHLGAVIPVVQGISRALIRKRYEDDNNRLCPILIHGDAAVASQGIVYEVIQMSQLEGYSTGGTIHLVINNQVGFTTNYPDARSSTYCTDIGKVIKAPVFHVNGDDVEALTHTVILAMEYRQAFHTDVFIDILCYRKHGHNEGDEPRFTQPLLYRAIENHPSPRDIYSDQLIGAGILTREEADKAEKDYEQMLEKKLARSKEDSVVHIQPFLEEEWKPYHAPFLSGIPTGISADRTRRIAGRINHLPPELKFFRKLEKIVKYRRETINQGKLDWAMAELLAYASLVDEGIPVRISGQDSIRGTFAHRHAAYTLEDTGELYFPLRHISAGQARFDIFNSPLSEYGVLGFEYGYSLASPEGLTIWEAQFGDFINVAQVIVDQYICAAGEKWGLKNGLVMLLPHGYEGQGPEHSSARIERFLAMAANNNILLANCSSPANFFHLLRRQVLAGYRIPLVVFTPKSLLRHPLCVSNLAEIHSGSFREVIDDDDVEEEKVSRVVFCSGKIFYDLLKRKNELSARDLALVRIEQLFPFPQQAIERVIGRYRNASLHLWVQEEPENMGAWRYLQDTLKNTELVPVARLASGSPATGLSGLHAVGQQEIISRVFRKCNCELKNQYCALQCTEGKSRQEILEVHHFFDRESRFSI